MHLKITDIFYGQHNKTYFRRTALYGGKERC